jgi:hypothetical protein
MEELDIASEREQLERDSLVAAIRKRPSSGLLPCGQCHWCDSAVQGQRIFCDGECADQHELMRRRGAMKG